jgi:NAD(P)-dependent dehydrogenase (short-subunit alcohol dehydrogenase family)
VALLTGANTGIGAAIAVLLAERGAGVLVTYYRINDPDDAGTLRAYAENRSEDAADVLSSIRAVGGKAVAVEADLSDPEAPARLFDVAEAELGSVDILVNRASTSSWSRPPSTSKKVVRCNRASLSIPGVSRWCSRPSASTMAVRTASTVSASGSRPSSASASTT